MIESEEARANVAQQGVRSEFWTDLLLPEMVHMCKTKGRQLISGKSEDDDVKRGWVQALEWIMNRPQIIIDEYVAAEERARSDDEEHRADEYRAEHGFRSPIRQAPEPGELKVDEG